MIDPPDKNTRKLPDPIPQFLILFLFAIPLLWPILRGQYFCTHDGDLHIYRLAALRHAIESGLWFSRWTPGLVFGYGFPFFNFRELLSYYIPEILHLVGLAIPTALNVVYGAALLLSGWGAFMLARDIWEDEKAGLVSALAYMAAPYLLLDVYVRGNLPESMALALLPWTLWLFRRLAISPTRLTFFAASLSVTALLLTHNISSLLFIPMLAVYLAFVWALHRFQNQPIRWLPVAAALLLGVTLAAFSWLPAILEKESVQLYLTYSTRGNDFHFNTVSLADLFSLPSPSDPSLLNPPVQVRIGLPQLLLAVAALWGWTCFREARKRWHIAFFAVSALLLVLLALPLTTPLWEKIPLIRYLQFPWRFIGRAALPLALLAGVPLALLPRRLSLPALVLAIAVLAVAAFPGLYPSSCSLPSYPTIGDVMQFERNSGLTGVDPLGAYLPRWVTERPSGSPMEDALRTGAAPRRFDSSLLPSGAVLLYESYGPNRATIELETPEAFRALYHTFYFPGWTVRIDGQPAAVGPASGTGLISFEVPAGRHTITVRWELTPLRSAAAAVSLVSLLLLFLSGLVLIPPQSLQHLHRQMQVSKLPITHLAALILLSLLLLAFKLLLVDPGHTFLRRSALAANALPALLDPNSGSPLHLADGLELIGYRVRPVPAGSELQIDLAWTVRQKPSGSYQSRIALLDQDGRVWSAKETYRPSTYQKHPPTGQWLPGTWVWDSHSVPILPGTPPGEYALQLVVFEKSTLSPLDVLDAGGTTLGPNAIIGRQEIERPARGKITPDDLQMQYDFNHRWGGLVLLGANLDREEAAPGDPILISLFWQATAPLPHLAIQLELVDASGSSLRRWVLPPVREDYSSSMWPVGDPLMGQHLLQVPGAAIDGAHTWNLTVLDSSGAPLGLPFTLGKLEVRAPQRVWQAPAVNHPLNVQYTPPSGAPLARLLGYDLVKQANSIDLTLVWQALDQTEDNYRVFAHLLAPDGSILSQSDGVPGEWTRPTSGWSAGEYIIDRHVLEIPAGLPDGVYSLAVGLYDLGTGLRLDAGRDATIMVAVP